MLLNFVTVVVWNDYATHNNYSKGDAGKRRVFCGRYMLNQE